MALAIPEFLSTRLGRPVAVLGAGVSGEGAIAPPLEARREGRRLRPEAGPSSRRRRADGHGLVVFSPGFPLLHPWLEIARKAGLHLHGGDRLRLRLLARPDRRGDRNERQDDAHRVPRPRRSAARAGARGRRATSASPSRSSWPTRTGARRRPSAVCEVSSFQAEQLGHFCADALLWTNFAEDHLERHPDMEAYFAAKWELVVRTPRGPLLRRELRAALRAPSSGARSRRARVRRDRGPARRRPARRDALRALSPAGEFHPRGRLVAQRGPGRGRALRRGAEPSASAATGSPGWPRSTAWPTGTTPRPRISTPSRRRLPGLREPGRADRRRPIQGRRPGGLRPQDRPARRARRAHRRDRPGACGGVRGVRRPPCGLRRASRTRFARPPAPPSRGATSCSARASPALTCSATTRTGATASSGPSPSFTRPEFDIALETTNDNLTPTE